MSYFCGYCRQTKELPGWHDCPPAIQGKQELGNVLVRLHELHVGGKEQPDDYLSDMATKFRKQSLDKLGE